VYFVLRSNASPGRAFEAPRKYTHLQISCCCLAERIKVLATRIIAQIKENSMVSQKQTHRRVCLSVVSMCQAAKPTHETYAPKTSITMPK
jgi:hypothetical protein